VTREEKSSNTEGTEQEHRGHGKIAMKGSGEVLRAEGALRMTIALGMEVHG
jgi:hypothetical protein